MKTRKNFEIQNFEPRTKVRVCVYMYENIRVPSPPPPPPTHPSWSVHDRTTFWPKTDLAGPLSF